MRRSDRVLAAALCLWAASAAAFEDLPLCSDVAGGQDCRIVLEDGTLVFGFGPGDPATLMVSQADPRGAWIAKVAPFDVSVGPGGPVARDLTGDGLPEILQPVAYGTANVAYRVLARDDLGRFASVGEILGGMPAGFEVQDGLILARSRVSAAAHLERGWLLQEGVLRAVYDLTTDLSAPAGARCTLAPGPAWSTRDVPSASIIQACEAAATSEGES